MTGAHLFKTPHVTNIPLAVLELNSLIFGQNLFYIHDEFISLTQ